MVWYAKSKPHGVNGWNKLIDLHTETVPMVTSLFTLGSILCNSKLKILLNPIR